MIANAVRRAMGRSRTTAGRLAFVSCGCPFVPTEKPRAQRAGFHADEGFEACQSARTANAVSELDPLASVHNPSVHVPYAAFNYFADCCATSSARHTHGTSGRPSSGGTGSKSSISPPQHHEVGHHRERERSDGEVPSRERDLADEVQPPEDDAREQQRQQQVQDDEHPDVALGSHAGVSTRNQLETTRCFSSCRRTDGRASVRSGVPTERRLESNPLRRVRPTGRKSPLDAHLQRDSQPATFCGPGGK